MARSRRMPSMGAVAAHHRLAVGVCARCSVVARCERAHVIDRTLGGLDDVQNLRPLCYPCHRDQPVFGPGEESVAMLWFELPTELAWYVARFDRWAGEHPVERAALVVEQSQREADTDRRSVLADAVVRELVAS